MFNPAPFFTYIFLMAYSPGPNNIMSMSNASEKGLKKAFPFNLGIFAGVSVVMTICVLFSRLLYEIIPQMALYMKIAGAGYMLWLAWSMLTKKKGHKADAASKQGFLTGALLQFVNPKLYIYGITAISSYIMPYFSDYAALLGFALLLAVVGVSSTICWAIFGVGLSRLFKNHDRAVGVVMAVLLCYCAVSLFL